MRIALFGAVVVSMLPALQPAGGSSSDAIARSLSFHAPFDGRLDAAFARGDGRLYSARDRKAAGSPTPGVDAGVVSIAPGAGRHGDAARIALESSPIVFFKGKDNVGYSARNWSGTVSVWFSLDPDRDLLPGYSDPLIITPRSWDDASLFVDFTRDDVPRRFRFAAFADKAVWNPANRRWEDVPVGDRPMIEIATPPFGAGRWTHVAWTWEGFNSDGTSAVVRAYLDGASAGTLTGRRQIYTWNPAEVLVAFGVEYRGLMDELAIFDRALTADEVRVLHALPNGIAALRR
jgi:hypothetical protein